MLETTKWKLLTITERRDTKKWKWNKLNKATYKHAMLATLRIVQIGFYNSTPNETIYVSLKKQSNQKNNANMDIVTNIF